MAAAGLLYVLLLSWTVRATPLRRVVAGFSPQTLTGPQGSPVRFVADKVELRQVCLEVLPVSPVNIIPPLLQFTHISSEGWTMSPLAAAVPYRHILTPPPNRYNNHGQYNIEFPFEVIF
jgi:hypothetical protein